LSGRLGLGEVYVFAVFIIAAVVFLVTMVYVLNLVKGFLANSLVKASAASEPVNVMPQSPPALVGSNILVNITITGNPQPYSLGELPNNALCVIRLINGTEFYAKGLVTYNPVAGYLGALLTCPLGYALTQFSGQVADLSIYLPTPLGSSIRLSLNYRPTVRLLVYPQSTYTGGNVTASLLVLNNSTGWVYVNVSGGPGYTVVPPGSLSIITRGYGPFNQPGTYNITLTYTVNNILSTSASASVTVIQPSTQPQYTLPEPCMPGNMAFGYVSNGTIGSLIDYSSLEVYYNALVYPGSIGGLANPVYLYLTSQPSFTAPSYYAVLMYYDVSGYKIGVANYPLVSGVIYPTQFMVNYTLFFIFIITNNGRGIVVYKSLNVNPAGTAPGSGSISYVNQLLSSVFGIGQNKIIDVSNGTIFSNAPLLYMVNVTKLINGNVKYQYVGVGVVIVSQTLIFITYPASAIFYWDYLCVGK